MRRLLTPIALAAVALLGAVAAQGETIQKGNLRVSFDGRLSPHELPRDRLAPVRARIESSIRTVDGSDPPPLRRVSIAVNREGKLSFAGLPTCSPTELQQTTTEAALDVCRRALVGRGRFAGRVAFPEIEPIQAEGRALVFNGRLNGKPALYLHIYSTSPIRITFVLPFEVKWQAKGRFGAILSAAIPRIASDRGYITDIELTIGREYRYRGHPRSFLSASCAALPGFATGFFALARTSFLFADGRTLAPTITRSCRVR
jgi:hypothetical protein